METLSLTKALEVIAESLIDERINMFGEYVNKLESRIAFLECQNNKEYLQQKEVCQSFGIGHRTLKTWVYSGLNEIWIGNRVYYSRRDIETYLNQNKIMPASDERILI